MAATVQTFTNRFPTFLTVEESLVQACLDEATSRIGLGAWGTGVDAAVHYLTGHLLAISPEGERMKLAPFDPKGKGGAATWYEYELNNMTLEVTAGFRVT